MKEGVRKDGKGMARIKERRVREREEERGGRMKRG